MVTLRRSFNPKGNTMSDNAAILPAPTPTPPPEPEWIAFGEGWRMNGTNWVIRPMAKPPLWYVFCGGMLFDSVCDDSDEAKLAVIELLCLMAEEPVP